MKSYAKLCVFALILSFSVTLPVRPAQADLFGGDVVVLSQILIQAIDQVYKLQQIIGTARETMSILEDMNSGIKEVLRLANTAHIPLPAGVYAQAKTVDQATWQARQIYGAISDRTPSYARTNYQSGVEALSLSQDAVDYSTFLDDQGERIKRSAVVANQASATRLAAETLGVLLHSVNHSSRIQAKELEMTSSEQIENSAKENARFETFVNTHSQIELELTGASISSLNEVQF